MNQDMEDVFNRYPPVVRKKMEKLRKLILETALSHKEIPEIEETLKWGEPAFLAKGGSTLRIDWKSNKPDQYALFFNCKTNLIPSFRRLYKDKLRFEGNRAIIINMDEKLPEKELRNCIFLTFTYHKWKKMPMGGLD